MFLEQAIRLVSQSPDNLAYHILTLLAVQATLAMSLWQWRQNRQDLFAGRLAGAAALIFFLRVLLAVVIASNNQSDVRVLLPPLERAIDMATTAALVWALAPSLKSAPRLNEVMFFLGIVATVITYMLAAQQWPALLSLGLNYGQTNQSFAWEIAQLTVLGFAILLIGVGRPADWGVRIFAIFPLALAHLAHLLGIEPSGNFIIDSALPYWVRLAYLISLPLMAVLAYRHTLAELLAEQIGTRPIGEQYANLLTWSSEAITTPQLDETLRGAVQLAAKVMGATFVAVGVSSAGDSLAVVTLRPSDENPDKPVIYRWILRITDWPGMQLALRQRAAVELIPNGIGARQLFSLYQELGIPSAGAMLIEPLFGSRDQQIGLLLLGGPPDLSRWSEDDRKLAPYLATFISRIIENTQTREAAVGPSAAELAKVERPLLDRITELESALTTAAERMRDAEVRLEQSHLDRQELQERLTNKNKQLSELQTQLTTLQDQPVIDHIYSLEEEVQGLREALQQAEEAMAMASAGEAGLSTDWVVMAITRYSAELEEAQRRIAYLESQIDGSDEVEVNDVLGQLGEELRRPLTAITGYTDILLNETMGLLTNKQRALLQHVQSGTNRMEQLLEGAAAKSQQIVQIRPLGTAKTINVTETLETAVNELLPLVREKQLVLDFDIENTLPPLPVQRDVLYRITLDLMRNAVHVSPPSGRVQLFARTGELMPPEKTTNAFGFLQLVITDSGAGIPPNLRPHLAHLYESPNGHDQKSIQGIDNLSDIARAYHLAHVNGGRIWVESEEGHGSKFYVLLPLLS